MSKPIQLSILDSIDHNKNIDIRINLVLKILITYNPRISEILKASWQNFHPDRFLILPGMKRSHSVVIRDKNILSSISGLDKVDSVLIFKGVTYYHVKSIIARNYSHLFNLIQHKKNRKLTHAFRYLNLENIDNDEQIEVILHHRSERSNIFYKNKLKGSLNHGKK